MKTSIKLFTAGLLCVPVSLLAYNLLLKRQLDSRNILVEMTKDSKYATTIKKLPPFKHLMVDGTLYTGADGKQGANSVSWIARVKVDNMGDDITSYRGFDPKWMDTHTNQKTSPPTIKLPLIYQDVVRYHVQHDTLYLSYYKKINPEELENYYESFLEITVDGGGTLRSVNGLNATFRTMGNFRNNDSLSINLTGNTKYEVTGLYMNKLNVVARDKAQLNIHDVVLKDINCSFYDHSILTVSPLNIKKFSAGHFDNTATININGPAGQLKDMLE